MLNTNVLRLAVIVAAVILAALSTACYKGPENGAKTTENGGKIDSRQEVSIAYLKSLHTGAPTRIESEISIVGRVISSDRHGNFSGTLVIEDPTGGIEIKLDVQQIFKIFEQFRLVRVRCNGLWIGSRGGTLQLGSQPVSGYETGFLSAAQTAEHLMLDPTMSTEISSRILTFSQLEPRHISTLVSFSGVRFVEAEHGLAWAETNSTGPSEAENGGGESRSDDATVNSTDSGKNQGGADPDDGGKNQGGGTPTDEIDPEIPSATNRHLIDAEGNILVVRTSRFADFATWPLPDGEGTIEGVVSVFGSEYQLVVVDAGKFHKVGTPTAVAW